MFATISADIVSSTSLSVNETIGLKQRIESLFSLLKVSYPDFEGRQIKGDYIECVMQNVSNVFRIAFIIKSCIKSFSTAKNEKTKNFHTYGIRMAIGIGDMRIVNTEQGIWDGEAIYLSGRALEEMSSLNKGTMSVHTSKKQLSAPLQTIALLTDAILNDMTVRQSEVVYYKLLGFKEADIAKKLGISQASVNNASTATKWYCIEESIKYMNNWLFLSLLLAHVIGDFYLQNDKYCAQKEERKFKSWFLYVHSLIIGVVSWAVVPIYEFRFYALAIAFSHLVIDVIKTYSPKGLWNFVIDQVAHLAILIIVTFFFDSTTKLPIQSMDCNGTYSIPLFILALLLCIKPANILIKLVLKKYQVGETQSCENIKNAGALIGNLERILTIIFVIIGQYEAIGFIIAAKSILRFKDTDTAKTEYVLAGTFLSFGIALLCGLMATK